MEKLKNNIDLDFYCEHCKTNNEITKENILPMKENGPGGDEFLIFEARCSNCGHLFPIEKDNIPMEVQEELLNEYANIVDEIHDIWSYMAQINDLEEKIRVAEQRLEEKKEERSKNPELAKRLYPNWLTNNEVIVNQFK